MAHGKSLELAKIGRALPTRSNSKKDRDRSLIGKARVKARKQFNKEFNTL